MGTLKGEGGPMDVPVSLHFALLCLTDAVFFTRRRQNALSVKRVGLTLLQWVSEVCLYVSYKWQAVVGETRGSCWRRKDGEAAWWGIQWNTPFTTLSGCQQMKMWGREEKWGHPDRSFQKEEKHWTEVFVKTWHTDMVYQTSFASPHKRLRVDLSTHFIFSETQQNYWNIQSLK